MARSKLKQNDCDLVLQGEITYKKIKKVKTQLEKVLAGRKKKIVVELNALEEIDIFGFQLFSAANKTAIAKKKTLTFKPPQHNNLLVKGARQAGIPFTNDLEAKDVAFVIDTDPEAEAEFREHFLMVVSDLGNTLKELSQQTGSPNDVAMKKIYRALHTLSETAQIYGCSEMDMVALLEKAFKLQMEGPPRKVDELMEILIASKNYLGKNACGEANVTTLTEKQDIILKLEKFTAKINGSHEAVFSYNIRFAPSQEIRKERNIKIIPFLQDLQQMGLCIIRANFADVPPLSEFDPQTCRVNWEISLTTSVDENTIKDSFIFFGRDEVHIEKEIQEGRRIGQILVDEGIIKEEQLKKALEKQQERTRPSKPLTDSLRVPAAKIDRLIMQVGELITLKAQFYQLAAIENHPRLFSLCEELERLSGAMRESSMEMRLVPIGNLFGKFRRVVRDLSGSLKKDVRLVAEGEETELDKTMIEQLDGSLVHIIRNCVDHGIELPEIRENAGKKRHGIIHLRAFQAGAQVVIEISDDGAGLNMEKILEKALLKGIIAKNQELTVIVKTLPDSFRGFKSLAGKA